MSERECKACHPGVDITRGHTPVTIECPCVVRDRVMLRDEPEPDENGNMVFQLRKGADDDPVNPSHYVLPNGLQVGVVSRYLTSNGAQATQYIARSTRLDGNNKSSTIAGRIEDLEKAIWFIQDEISRLEEEEGLA